MMILFLIVSFISIVLYLIKIHYEYWEKRDVPGPKPKFIVGNFGKTFLAKKAFFEEMADIYNKYKKHGVVGIYRGSSPALLVCSPEIIKDITVKSFSHFVDNDIQLDQNRDRLLGRNPFFITGEKWKQTRSMLTPAFTLGKLRLLYPLIENNSEELVEFIAKKVCSLESYETKELCAKFTLNNVASCAFGIDGKCFENENSDFREVARSFVTPNTFQQVLFVISLIFPSLQFLLPFRFAPKKCEDQIIDIVNQTLDYRQKNNVVRNDFLQLLIQLKDTQPNFTNLDVAAHSAGFFIDGFETSSTVMSIVLHQLAENPHVQLRLRNEINQAFEKNNSRLSCEMIQELPYLESVFNETLRLFPAIAVLGKTCTKPYTFQPSSAEGISKPIHVEKDTRVFLSLFGMQRDAKYFEKPEEFQPERFLGSNKDNIHKYSFLPFGEGPRQCLGMKFGILQVKAGVAYIIKNFEITINKKDKKPIEFNPFNFVIEFVGGIWINFKKIN